MRKILTMVVMAMGMGLMVAGCNKENIGEEGNDSGVTGSLTVTIQNANGNNGANDSRASGIPTEANENSVKSFAVYVFNIGGELEKSQVFTETLTGTVSGLSTSSNKNIVVLVNYEYDELNGMTLYSDLMARTLSLDSQDPAEIATNGLFMSGQATNVNLAEVADPLVIGVDRAVARVVLGSITVSPDATSNLEEFSFNGVSMQKVASMAYLLDNGIPTLADGDYIGGLDGDVSQSGSETENNPLLYTPYTPAAITAGTVVVPQIYFYVFPNDDVQGNATLMTIDATYRGEQVYYTFAINDTDFETAQTGDPDGSFIKRNMIYTLHITLRALANYVGDPDDNDLVDVNIAVEVNDWAGEIIQNLVW